jgi:hypothetical protein
LFFVLFCFVFASFVNLTRSMFLKVDVDSCHSNTSTVIHQLTHDNQQMQATVTQLEKQQSALMQELTLLRDENHHLHHNVGALIKSVISEFFISFFRLL